MKNLELLETFKLENPKVFLMMRIGKLEHLNLFLNGQIRFTRASYYSDPNFLKEPFYDEDEGLTAIYQADDMAITIGGGEKTLKLDSNSGFVAQIKIKNIQDNYISCLYSMNAGEWSHKSFDESELENFKNHVRLSKKMKSYGDYIWYISDWKEFKNRIKAACEKHKILLTGRLIHYENFSTLRGKVHEQYRHFVKKNNFAHEKEYRFRIDSLSVSKDNFVLDIGNLSDISTIISVEQFEKTWDIRFD